MLPGDYRRPTVPVKGREAVAGRPGEVCSQQTCASIGLISQIPTGAPQAKLRQHGAHFTADAKSPAHGHARKTESRRVGTRRLDRQDVRCYLLLATRTRPLGFFGVTIAVATVGVTSASSLTRPWLKRTTSVPEASLPSALKFG